MILARQKAILFLFGLGCLPVIPQTTAVLTVRLTDAGGAVVQAAEVTIENRATGFQRRLTPDAGGAFVLWEAPPQTYRLHVDAPGFLPISREVVLRANVPVALDLTVELAEVRARIDVGVAETTELIDVSATGTRTALSSEVLEKTPAPLGSRGVETYLVSFPGFAVNANGAIHPRGAHNQMTFVIDGLPINDQLTGAFATALDPNIVDGLELFTGDIPAEFGAKISGVAAISTRSGAGSGRKLFGSTQTGADQFDTLQTITQAGGEQGRLAYFASLFATRTNRFLDQVSLDNLHNGGNAQRAFLRLDYRLSSQDALHLHAMLGRSSFQLANQRSQHEAGMDQRQLLRDASFWLRWNRILSPSAAWESTLGYRPTIGQLMPSAGDTPVTAAQARHLTTVTSANRLNWLRGAHAIRSGLDWQRFPVSENFAMAITDPAFNDPAASNYNPALAAHDLTRGGDWFRFTRRRAGNLFSGFIQDAVRWGRFAFSLGARHDEYRFLVQGRQLQPRVGVAFHLRETGTVLRASYNRNYQTPPNENLLLSSSEEASRLAPASVREALGQTFVPIVPQRENVFEAGVQQALFGRASLNAAVYHKNSRDQQDNNNFFDTGIIFPVTLARIRVNGAEGRLTLPDYRGLKLMVSATHARAVSTPPFTGGLFLGQEAIDLLSEGPFLIDHDQKLSLQTSAQYARGRRWWFSASVRYDSGLVANPSDPEEVARDPDFFDLLPYVNLTSNPARVRPRTMTDFAVSYQAWRADRRWWDVQFQLTNAFNRTALYNFQSVFVGTRLVAPRAAGVKVRCYW